MVPHTVGSCRTLPTGALDTHDQHRNRPPIAGVCEGVRHVAPRGRRYHSSGTTAPGRTSRTPGRCLTKAWPEKGSAWPNRPTDPSTCTARRTSRGGIPPWRSAHPERIRTHEGPMHRCMGAVCGRCASMRGSVRLRPRTPVSRPSWTPGRPASRLHSTSPPRWASTPTTSWRSARSGRSVWRSTRSMTCACSSRGFPSIG